MPELEDIIKKFPAEIRAPMMRLEHWMKTNRHMTKNEAELEDILNEFSAEIRKPMRRFVEWMQTH